MKGNSRKWSKKSPKERMLKIASIYILSPDLKAVFKNIQDCHRYSQHCREPKCMLITGRQGVGKTSLAEFYIKDYPRTETEGIVEVPVLYLKIEVPATPKNLVSALLAELGDLAAEKGNIGSQTRRLRKFLKELKTGLIILDEFQHFIDGDSLKVLKTISDWLKLMIDNSKLPVVLMGMPYSHIILDARGNEQLKRRFSLRRSIEPFGWGGTSEKQRDFRSFLKLIDDELPFDKRANLADKTMAFRFYCATNGVISYVMDLIGTAAISAIEQSLETIDIDLLAAAYDESLALAYPERENPFRRTTNELKILPFADWLPDFKNLKDLRGENDSAREVLRRK
jgi:predicted AAA+ superfamily ATPase